MELLNGKIGIDDMNDFLDSIDDKIESKLFRQFIEREWVQPQLHYLPPRPVTSRQHRESQE